MLRGLNSSTVGHNSRLQNRTSFSWPAPVARALTSRGHCLAQAATVHSISTSAGLAAQQQNATAAYVHLPFCKKKCYYCDFPVEAVGKSLETTRVQQRMHNYVQALLREIASTSPRGTAPLTSVYFGGGTPSLVPPAQIQLILATLRMQFGISGDAEISLEADPGTFDSNRLQEYRSLGVNRLSVGVQAFDEATLNLCGRSHDLADVYRAIQAVHDSGISNWSLDLISGLPKLGLDSWQHSLQEAVKAGPTHVSVYDLQVEENTPFARWYTPGQAPLPPDDAAADMYGAASTVLTTAGFEHYEISSYARPGCRSRHNQVYWSGAPYHAFGVGAASYLEGRRFSRPKNIQQYDTWVTEFAQSGSGTPGFEATSVSKTEPPQTQEELLLDHVMLRLRLSDGLELGPAFQSQYGSKAAIAIWAALQPHTRLGRAQALDAAGNVLHPESSATASGVAPPHDSSPVSQDGSVGMTATAVDTAIAAASASSSSSSAAAAAGMAASAAAAGTDSSECSVHVNGGAQRIGGGLHGPDGVTAQRQQPYAGGSVPHRVRLTDPVGFLTSNDVISDVFARL